MPSSTTTLFLILLVEAAVPAVCVSPIFQKPAWHSAPPEGAKSLVVGGVKPVPAKTNVDCSVTHVAENNSTEFKKFLPACLDHLHDLVHSVDGSYTDLQLETVLEHECMYEKSFPLTSDDGFTKSTHCKEYSCLLVKAREAELSHGKVSAYTMACQSYWTLQHPVLLAGKAPVFTEETMPAVSTTLLCIINLTVLYFGLYTALVIVRTLNSFKVQNLVGIQHILESGCTTVTYAPMLCVLFLGARMRAVQLSQGQTEKYQLPQPWVQAAMIVASTAIVAQVVLVLMVGVMSGASKVATDVEGNLDMSSMGEFANPHAVKLLTVARYIVMAMLYGGFTAVVVGIFVMQGPKEIMGEQELPVSPVVMCTILLSGLFFFVYLFVAVVRTCFELSTSLRSSQLLLKLEASAAQAKMTVNFAPMLCILFIGTRMRALQIDPQNGNPQSWAQKCFFMCTCSVLLQCILVIVLPFVAKGQCKRGAFEGDIAFNMENQIVGVVVTSVRYLCLLALYAGTAAVVYSVFVIEHPDGPAQTPPISPAMRCVINLTAQYFFIYFMLFVCITVKSFGMGGTTMDGSDAEQGFQNQSSISKLMTKAIAIFDAARGTVMFAPMLAILFIGARMRALQLTRSQDGTIPPNAGPQPWVQDAMFLATWAIFVQLVMAIAVPVLSGADKPEVDSDGNVKVPQQSNKWLIIVAEGVRYLSLFFLYGGAMLVVVGIFLMTPDTLPPHNKQQPLV